MMFFPPGLSIMQPMSKREELRKKRQQEARRQQITIIGVVAVVAVIIAGLLIIPNLRPADEVIVPAVENFPSPDGKALGPKDAKVIVQEFADFQCPGCRQFAAGAGRQIKDEYIATGQSVRFEYYHFPIVDQIAGGRESRNAAQASECANEQGQFWLYHDYLFANVRGENVGSFRDLNLKAMAASAGLDTAQFNACYDSGKYASAVSADETLGRNFGVSGTPTIFVNQRQVQASYEALKAAIDLALAQP